jgi:Uma2 family endonuclease
MVQQTIGWGTPRKEPPPHKITFEEFLEWYTDDLPAEWVDGDVVIPMPPDLPHQEIVLFLARLLSDLAEHDDAGRVIVAPYLVRLPEPLRRAREPDLLFIGKPNLHRLTRLYLAGPPDIAVEVVSPDSVTRDRREKFAEYEVAGVVEYWLIDPTRRTAEFNRLGADGRYALVLGGETGVFTSAVLPRLRLRVEWLWQDPKPKVMDVVREMGL